MMMIVSRLCENMIVWYRCIMANLNIAKKLIPTSQTELQCGDIFSTSPHIAL